VAAPDSPRQPEPRLPACPSKVSRSAQYRAQVAANADPATPIPLWVGLYLALFLLVLFGGFYSGTANTNTHGWLATLSAALELSGVLLVASPELRPRAERILASVRRILRRWVKALVGRIRRLFGIHLKSGTAETGLSVSGSVEAEVQRGFEDPPADGEGLDQKVDYLLRQDQRFKDLFHLIENQGLKQVEQLRKALERTASSLSKETAEAVRRLSESELHMRFLGLAYIVVGLVLSYATNLS
jgi:hypothetical protein